MGIPTLSIRIFDAVGPCNRRHPREINRTDSRRFSTPAPFKVIAAGARSGCCRVPFPRATTPTGTIKVTFHASFFLRERWALMRERFILFFASSISFARRLGEWRLAIGLVSELNPKISLFNRIWEANFSVKFKLADQSWSCKRVRHFTKDQFWFGSPFFTCSFLSSGSWGISSLSLWSAERAIYNRILIFSCAILLLAIWCCYCPGYRSI